MDSNLVVFALCPDAESYWKLQYSPSKKILLKCFITPSIISYRNAFAAFLTSFLQNQQTPYVDDHVEPLE